MNNCSWGHNKRWKETDSINRGENKRKSLGQEHLDKSVMEGSCLLFLPKENTYKILEILLYKNNSMTATYYSLQFNYQSKV